MTEPAKLPPVGEGGPFQIGGELWPGLAKLVEECGELLQMVGKIMAYPEQDDHPDGTTSMRQRLVQELGDVRACMIFLAEENGINKADIHTRADYKLERFRHWHEILRDMA